MKKKLMDVHSTITVTASEKYDVIIGRGLLARVGELIADKISKCKVAIITDDTVDALYSDKVIFSLKAKGFETAKFVFPHGEKSKCFKTYQDIILFLAENSFTRSDAVIALGGGVVGDITGFASATFLRGIKYFQVPTTLLAQIDSSVGGKTAIDIPQGKNLVGAFYQPQAVICDIDALDTLPKEVFLDGMGEASKYAVLDKKIFNLVKSQDYKLEELVTLCVDYKRKIVESDEFDKGNRALLNLGHTPAHGIEKLSNFSITHGNAVGMGLKIILKASLKQGNITEPVYNELTSIVTKLVGENECPFSIEDICKNSLSDKKRSGDDISLVTIHGVGDCRIEKIKVENLTEYLS